MTSVARVADPSDTVDLTLLRSYSVSARRHGGFVQFEGRPYPTGFRGDAGSAEHQITVGFTDATQGECAAFEAFLARCVDSPDARITLTPDTGTLVDEPVTVEVHDWVRTHTRPFLVEITLTATRVG